MTNSIDTTETLEIFDARTQNRKEEKKINRQRIINFYRRNPTASRKAAAEALKLSYSCICGHCRQLDNEFFENAAEDHEDYKAREAKLFDKLADILDIDWPGEKDVDYRTRVLTAALYALAYR